jgi:hypothetical protein
MLVTQFSINKPGTRSMLLASTLGHEVLGCLRPVSEELVPSVTHWRDDAVHAARAHLNLLDALRQPHVRRQTHGLRSVVFEDGCDAHCRSSGWDMAKIYAIRCSRPTAWCSFRH